LTMMTAGMPVLTPFTGRSTWASRSWGSMNSPEGAVGDADEAVTPARVMRGIFARHLGDEYHRPDQYEHLRCEKDTKKGRLSSEKRNSPSGATGIEPAISGLTGRRDNQLRYAPNAMQLADADCVQGALYPGSQVLVNRFRGVTPDRRGGRTVGCTQAGRTRDDAEWGSSSRGWRRPSAT
jgi:hypothetical protein